MRGALLVPLALAAVPAVSFSSDCLRLFSAAETAPPIDRVAAPSLITAWRGGSIGMSTRDHTTRQVELAGKSWRVDEFTAVLKEGSPRMIAESIESDPRYQGYSVRWYYNLGYDYSSTQFVRTEQTIGSSEIQVMQTSYHVADGPSVSASATASGTRSWADGGPILSEIGGLMRFVLIDVHGGRGVYPEERVEARLAREHEFAERGASYMVLVSPNGEPAIVYRVLPGNAMEWRFFQLPVRSSRYIEPVEVEIEFPWLKLKERENGILVYELGRLAKDSVPREFPVSSRGLGLFYTDAARFLLGDLPRDLGHRIIEPASEIPQFVDPDGRSVLRPGVVVASVAESVFQVHMSRYGKYDSDGNVINPHGWVVEKTPAQLKAEMEEWEKETGRTFNLPPDYQFPYIIKISTEDYLKLHPVK